jgi:hypothetical protein
MLKTFIFLVSFVFISAQLAFSGCISGDCINGTGTFEFKDGDVYEGEWSNGQLNGKGKLTSHAGGYYEGHFTVGKYNGQGTLVTADGETISGEFKDNKPPEPERAINLWELSDNKIYAMLSDAARVPNQIKYLDGPRIYKIREGWFDNKITDKKQAISMAFDYLLRVNDYYDSQAAAQMRERQVNNQIAVPKRPIYRASPDYDFAKPRPPIQNTLPMPSISDKCKSRWPNNYFMQKNCIKSERESKSWVESNQ